MTRPGRDPAVPSLSAALALPPAALARCPPSKSAFLKELTEVDFNFPPLFVSGIYIS